MNLNNINAIQGAGAVSDADAFIISDNPSGIEQQKLRRATALQIKTYVGSQLQGGLTQDFTITESFAFGGNRVLFNANVSSTGVAFQHVEFNFDNSGTANPDFVPIKLGSRLWFFDLDVLGDEVGIVIGGNGHPSLTDAKGWANSYSFTATKSDINPATATAAQCAERINALINALTRVGLSEGHGLLR